MAALAHSPIFKVSTPIIRRVRSNSQASIEATNPKNCPNKFRSDKLSNYKTKNECKLPRRSYLPLAEMLTLIKKR